MRLGGGRRLLRGGGRCRSLGPRNDRCEKRRLPPKMACKLVVKDFHGEIALGASAVLGESPVEMPRQPLSDKRRNNGVGIPGGVADRNRRARSFSRTAV